MNHSQTAGTQLRGGGEGRALTPSPSSSASRRRSASRCMRVATSGCSPPHGTRFSLRRSTSCAQQQPTTGRRVSGPARAPRRTCPCLCVCKRRVDMRRAHAVLIGLVRRMHGGHGPRHLHGHCRMSVQRRGAMRACTLRNAARIISTACHTQGPRHAPRRRHPVALPPPPRPASPARWHPRRGRSNSTGDCKAAQRRRPARLLSDLGGHLCGQDGQAQVQHARRQHPACMAAWQHCSVVRSVHRAARWHAQEEPYMT